MILKFLRALLEDLTTALWTEDIIPEAEIFVEEEGGFEDPLVAVLALDFVWATLSGLCAIRVL